MTPALLVWRSLLHHWRTNLAVVLGAAVGIGVILGALAVGDSVRGSLQQIHAHRLGKTDLALAGGDRFFRAKLGPSISELLKKPVSSVLITPSVALAGFDKQQRIIPGVQLVGVDATFWSLAPQRPRFGPVPNGQVILNEPLARALNVGPGDTLILRVPKPSPLPRDMPLASTSESVIGMSVVVQTIASDQEFGRFGLAAQQVAPLNAFVPLEWLNQQLGLNDRANLMLIGADGTVTVEAATNAFKQRMRLADLQYDIRLWPVPGVFELRTDRVFLDPPVVRAVEAATADLTGVLTYFVNELRVGDRATPYSMVTGIGDLRQTRPQPVGARPAPAWAAASAVPGDMADDQVIINQWLADDLHARVGDSLQIKYFVPGPGRTLVERSNTFTIRSIVSMEGAYADRSLMPDFPGLSDAENCRDWDPSLPVDLSKIRDKDEQYWKTFRGTPKAFVTLRAARAMWGNRFGDLTALRVPQYVKFRDRLRDAVQENVDPASVGLRFVNVRSRAMAAAGQSVDFAQLFTGLSFFLIGASALLAGLLFNLSAQQRSGQWGTLLALGIPRRQVRKLMWTEAGLLVAIAALLGLPLGIGYTALVLRGLTTLWNDAVGTTSLSLHLTPQSLIIGLFIGGAATVLALGLAMRQLQRQPVAQLLAWAGESSTNGMSRAEAPMPKWRQWLLPPWGLHHAAACGAVALIAVTLGWLGGHARATGAFFAAGFLLLLAGGCAARWMLHRLSHALKPETLALSSLAWQSTARRSGRSLAIVLLLACGCFLIVAVGANRKSASSNANIRASGTGGFAHYMQTTIPIFENFDDPASVQKLGLRKGTLDEASVVPLRLRDGDDASCLNLNRAQEPRLLGVNPTMLAKRGAFAFASFISTPGVKLTSPWLLLDQALEEGRVVPAIGDQATVVWGLGKGLGDELSYVDEGGKPVRVRIVGLLADSMLQGSLILSESQFERLFPSLSGHRVFLIDVPPAAHERLTTGLSRGLRDLGVEIVPAPQRLAMFHAVENTYLSIFQSLGALGLLLGSAGLAAVVMRNVLERRGELAMLRALGFTAQRMRNLILLEHLGLLAFGVGTGVVAAIVAVAPAVGNQGSLKTALITAGWVLLIALGGLVWIVLATLWATRGPLLEALRSE